MLCVHGKTTFPNEPFYLDGHLQLYKLFPLVTFQISSANVPTGKKRQTKVNNPALSSQNKGHLFEMVDNNKRRKKKKKEKNNITLERERADMIVQAGAARRRNSGRHVRHNNPLPGQALEAVPMQRERERLYSLSLSHIYVL